MRVLVLGAGGAASNGFCRALRLAGGYQLVGTNSNPDDLHLSECEENHLIPHVSDREGWISELDRILRTDKPVFVHAQNDAEVEAVARNREVFDSAGCKTYLPSLDTILRCRDKWTSYRIWYAAGVPVPDTMLAEGRFALSQMHAKHGKVWLRPRVGAGGQKALRTSNFKLAQEWLNEHDGWGEFTVADCLTSKTVTVQQLYWRGSLVCSQQRTRDSWANAGSSATGVSGSTGVGVTSSDKRADSVADDAVAAIDKEPHGLYGIDMCRRADGEPCVTEINIGRFFTTAPEFFAMAGDNWAVTYVANGMYEGVIQRWHPWRNEIPDGKRWIRGMDKLPVLAA